MGTRDLVRFVRCTKPVFDWVMYAGWEEGGVWGVGCGVWGVGFECGSGRRCMGECELDRSRGE